jgi:hypothetical protein
MSLRYGDYKLTAKFLICENIQNANIIFNLCRESAELPEGIYKGVKTHKPLNWKSCAKAIISYNCQNNLLQVTYSKEKYLTD